MFSNYSWMWVFMNNPGFIHTMARKNQFILIFSLLLIVVFSGCTTLAPKRSRIEIPAPSVRSSKKHKTWKSSPTVSGSALELYVKGQRAYYQGEYEAALNNFRAAGESDPDFMEPRVGLGKVLLDIGQFEKAVQIFADVIQKDTGYFDAYVGLGRAFLNEKEYDQSVKALENSLTLIPHHPGAEEVLEIAREKSADRHLMLGEKKKSLGDMNGGETEFKKVLKLDPQNIEAHLQLAHILIARKQYPLAEDHLKKVLSEDFKNTDALGLLAKVFYRTKRLEKALKACQRLLEIDPSNQEAHTNLQTVQKAFSSDPDIPLAYYELSSSHRITRGDLAAILNMGLKNVDPLPQLENQVKINDISKHWARKYIMATVNNGLMESVNRTFSPNDLITRGDLAAIIYRIAVRFDSTAKDEIKRIYTPYRDISPDHHLYKPTFYLLKTRIMEGEEKHYFGFASKVPGIEALEVIDRLEDYLSKLKEPGSLKLS